MSNFNCEQCGAVCIDSLQGYATGCKHYPADQVAARSVHTTARGAIELLNIPNGWKHLEDMDGINNLKSSN